MKYYTIKEPEDGFLYRNGKVEIYNHELFERHTGPEQRFLHGQKFELLKLNGPFVYLYTKQMDITIVTGSGYFDLHFVEIQLDTLKILKETVLQ